MNIDRSQILGGFNKSDDKNGIEISNDDLKKGVNGLFVSEDGELQLKNPNSIAYKMRGLINEIF